MSIVSSQEYGLCRIELDGAMEIAGAAELKELLLQTMETGQRICVSLAGVAGLDVTAVQLLWAAEREAKRRGLDFDISEPPEPVRTFLKEAGLESLFGFHEDQAKLRAANQLPHALETQPGKNPGARRDGPENG